MAPSLDRDSVHLIQLITEERPGCQKGFSQSWSHCHDYHQMLPGETLHVSVFSTLKSTKAVGPTASKVYDSTTK